MVKILICGTPGVGKTTLCALLKAAMPQLIVINVAELVVQKGLHEGKDVEWDSFIMDEDKVCDEMEPIMEDSSKSVLVDHHGCDFFPESWFDLIVVLRCDNEILYPRLEKRCYSEKKISENIQAEIMQVVLEEARDSYSEEIIWELWSNTSEQLQQHCQKILDWIGQQSNK